MPQINFHTTEEFERDLLVVMAAMKIFGKSNAIRFAMHQVAEALCRREADFARQAAGKIENETNAVRPKSSR